MIGVAIIQTCTLFQNNDKLYLKVTTCINCSIHVIYLVHAYRYRPTMLSTHGHNLWQRLTVNIHALTEMSLYCSVKSKLNFRDWRLTMLVGSLAWHGVMHRSLWCGAYVVVKFDEVVLSLF